MYPITEAVMALFEAEHRKVLRITGTDKNGAAITITDDNVMEDSFQIDRYSCNGEKLEVGTAIAAQMSFTLENGDGTYDGIVFEDTELFAEVGVADWTQENPTIYWVPCGYFTPDMQPRRLTTISITALDRMAKFDVVVDATDLTFPATIAGLVGQVCTVCGVTLAQSIAKLTNADVTVATLPSANGGMTTYRNLIQWCAGIMGTNAWFDWNGLLRFSWYNNATNYVSTRDNRYSSDLYENDLTVTGVEYTNDSGIVIVEGMDDYAIDLTGNAIAGPLIATVLPPLNTALNGFTYRPFTAAAINAPYLWPMDIVTFTDKNGGAHSSALTNVAFGLNGTTALESKGMTYAINKAAQPKGFTREQAQLVNQVVAKNVESHIDDYLTQQEIFNRLTDNGAAQGLVLYDGQLYMNASYINAGVLNVGLINFRDYSPPYQAPNEYDPDSLFSGQAIQNGWIVNRDGSSDIGIIGCSDAVPLRGKTLIITLTSRNHITALGGYYDYIGEDGQIWSETLPETEPPAYGREDAEGNLDGATDNGEYEQYSTKYYVRENEVGFYLTVRCSGVKSISVSESYSNNFGLRYGNNIGLNYKGLQVGKFVVDRSGNATFNGDAIFNGDVSFANPGAARNALAITPANIGAPTTGGTGATGTWGINVTGSAGSVAWGNVSGKPANYPGGCTGNAATATKATQDGSGNNIGNTYLKMNTAGGIASCGGGGSNWYFRIATVEITDAYINRPIVFEISGRGWELTWVQLIFASISGTDPGLQSFTTNNWTDFWVKKTATSTWEVYGKYNETWGFATLHRVTGCGADIGVTVNMVNIGTTKPSGATKASYSGNVSYANSADNAANVTGTVAVGHGGTGATTAEAARGNLGIHSGTTVATFSNGKLTLPFSTFGVSGRPATLILTAQSAPVSMQYQFDESSSNVVIYSWNKTGGNWNNILRFGWICIP